MTETMTIAPVLKSVHVACTPERAFETFTRGIGSWWPLETHALHPGEVREVVWEEREGGEVYEISTAGEQVALGDRARLVAADRAHDRLAGRPDGRGDDGGRGALHARGRRDARRPRAPRLGAARSDGRRGARELRQRERLGDGDRPVRGAATWRLRLHTPTSSRLGGRAVAEQRSHELGEAARSEDRLRRRLLELGHASTSAARTRTRR